MQKNDAAGHSEAAGKPEWVDPDVLAKLREAGPGWQARVNAILRKAVLDAA